MFEGHDTTSNGRSIFFALGTHYATAGIFCSLASSTNFVTCSCFPSRVAVHAGIAWTLYNLALHQEHQEKCRQEVDTVFSEKDEDNDITR